MCNGFSTAHDRDRLHLHFYSIGRYILTKKPFIYDFNGERDRYDITHLYKPREGTNAERLSLFNAVTQATLLAKKFFSLPDPSKADVFFDLRVSNKI